MRTQKWSCTLFLQATLSNVQARKEVACCTLKIVIGVVVGSFLLLNLCVGFLVKTGANRSDISSLLGKKDNFCFNQHICP